MARVTSAALAATVYLASSVLLAWYWPDASFDQRLALGLVPGLTALGVLTMLGAPAIVPRLQEGRRARRSVYLLCLAGLVLVVVDRAMVVAAYALRLVTLTFGDAVRVETFALPLLARCVAGLAVAALGSEAFLRARLLGALQPGLGDTGAVLATGVLDGIARLCTFATRYWPPTGLEVAALGASWVAQGIGLGALAQATGSIIPSSIALGLGMVLEGKVLGDVEQSDGALLYYVPARRAAFLGWQLLTGMAVLLAALALARLARSRSVRATGSPLAAGEPAREARGSRGDNTDA